jgi:hypothetical protein
MAKACAEQLQFSRSVHLHRVQPVGHRHLPACVPSAHTLTVEVVEAEPVVGLHTEPAAREVDALVT